MSSKANLWKSYLLIRRNRARKKRHLRKMAFQLMVDKTTAFYSLILVGYVFASLFIFGDTIHQYENDLIRFEQLAMERLPLLPGIILLAYVTQAFKNSGVLFTNSELKLSYLPFSIKRIWTYVVLEKWLKSFILFLIIGGVIGTILPLSYSFLFTYLGTLWLLSVLLTIPKWKLFQSTWFIKIMAIILAMFINGVIFFSGFMYGGVIVIIGIIVLNILLIPRLFHNIHWGRVAEVSDFEVWNMQITQFASNVKLKRAKKYSILQNTKRRKQPFLYAEKSIHYRLWQVYITKQLTLILQVVGTLFLLITILRFFHSIYVYIGIAIAIHVYSALIASLFSDRFQSDIVEVLPWNLVGYKESYKKWFYFGMIPIALPIIFHFTFNFSVWAPVQLALIYCSILLHYHVKVDKVISILRKEHKKFTLEEVLAFSSLVFIVLSALYPAIALLFIVIMYILIKKYPRVISVTD